MKKEERIYLDNAAATPVSDEVFRAMEPYFTVEFGNPSAIHREGQRARKAVEEAREELARTLRVRASDIVFTGNGTEANNLALFGIADALFEKGRAYEDMEIIATKIEHPSIIETLDVLRDRGVNVKYAPLNGEGLIESAAFENLLSERTVLATFAYANSEIGVVQDVKRISRIVRKFNAEHETGIKVHLDASQAPLWLPCQMDMLGVDLMTLDAGKCCGPKGVGVLAYKHGVKLRSQLHGGDQEHGLRAGTESTPLIVGCVRAVVHAQEHRELRSEAIAPLRNVMLETLEREIPGVLLNGSRTRRIANNVNISIPDIDSEFAVVKLDSRGIAASTKSACSGAKGGGSHVVEAISGDLERASSTIRFSLGPTTTEREVLKAVSILKEHVLAMRKTGVPGTEYIDPSQK